MGADGSLTGTPCAVFLACADAVFAVSFVGCTFGDGDFLAVWTGLTVTGLGAPWDTILFAARIEFVGLSVTVVVDAVPTSLGVVFWAGGAWDTVPPFGSVEIRWVTGL